MSLWMSLKDRLSAALVPLLVLGALVYFGFHMVQGRHGLSAFAQYGQEIAVLEDQAQRVAAERTQIQNQVTLLQPRSVDPDYLDEMARRQLNYIAPDEIVIPLPAVPQSR
jgi:cell division protein FtsB